MEALQVSINKARSGLCALVQAAAEGKTIILTSWGVPKAKLGPCAPEASPWRVDKPDDPARYGDLQNPVMEPWQ